jgi:hypothetical protein
MQNRNYAAAPHYEVLSILLLDFFTLSEAQMF